MKPRKVPQLGTVTATGPLTIHTDGDPATDMFPVFYVGVAPGIGDRVQWMMVDSQTLIVYVLTPT